MCQETIPSFNWCTSTNCCKNYIKYSCQANSVVGRVSPSYNLILSLGHSHPQPTLVPTCSDDHSFEEKKTGLTWAYIVKWVLGKIFSVAFRPCPSAQVGGGSVSGACASSARLIESNDCNRRIRMNDISLYAN
jgi:hypothetical protein